MVLKIVLLLNLSVVTGIPNNTWHNLLLGMSIFQGLEAYQNSFLSPRFLHHSLGSTTTNPFIERDFPGIKHRWVNLQMWDQLDSDACHIFSTIDLLSATLEQEGYQGSLSPESLFLQHYFATGALKKNIDYILSFASTKNQEPLKTHFGECGSIEDNFALLQKHGNTPTISNYLPFNEICSLLRKVRFMRHKMIQYIKSGGQLDPSEVMDLLNESGFKKLQEACSHISHLKKDEECSKLLKKIKLQNKTLTGDLAQRKKFLLQQLEEKPLGASVLAYDKLLKFPNNNVPLVEKALAHSVIIVGYHTGLDTFLIKNSWGTPSLDMVPTACLLPNILEIQYFSLLTAEDRIFEEYKNFF